MNKEEIKKVIEKIQKKIETFHSFKYKFLTDLIIEDTIGWYEFRRNRDFNHQYRLLNAITELLDDKLIRGLNDPCSEYGHTYYLITQKGIGWLKKELKNRGENNE